MKKQDILYKILNKISIFTIIMVTFITASLALFLPKEYLSKLKLLKYSNESGYIFGILFLISISSLLVLIGVKIYNYRYIIKKLKNLSPEEKHFLSIYIFWNTKTQSTNINGVILGLINKNILYNPKKIYELDKVNAINIYDWIWNYLNKNKKLLKLNKNKNQITLSEEKIKDLERLQSLIENKSS